MHISFFIISSLVFIVNFWKSWIQIMYMIDENFAWDEMMTSHLRDKSLIPKQQQSAPGFVHFNGKALLVFKELLYRPQRILVTRLSLLNLLILKSASLSRQSIYSARGLWVCICVSVQVGSSQSLTLEQTQADLIKLHSSGVEQSCRIH